MERIEKTEKRNEWDISIKRNNKKQNQRKKRNRINRKNRKNGK